MDDSIAVSIFTMVIGAVLGSILAPFSQELVERLFGKKRKVGVESAFLFLLVANGIWIIGEVFIASELLSSPLTILGGAFILIIAALSLTLAYRGLSTANEDDYNFLAKRNSPLGLLILGNLFWICLC